MDVNLVALRLSTINNFIYQKCLLPKEKFPAKARPGQWAKCYFIELKSGRRNFALNQIFPREDIVNVCYLDTSVCEFFCHNEHQIILDSVVVLENKDELKKIEVLYQLNLQYFLENSSLISKLYLRDLAQILLQKYCLMNNCVVKDLNLEDYGVDAICIQIDGSPNDTYMITNDTFINIKNISITNKILSEDLVSLDVEPFVRARKELDDLMLLAKLQYFHDSNPCMSPNVLLVGPVGCGKTTLIDNFLVDHQCNTFRIEIANCLKQYPGETEAKLRKVFDAACQFENQFKPKEPTIILLEEIHLLCPQTNTSGKSSETLSNSMRISGQLLRLIDNLFFARSNVMCIATTSDPDNLNEFARRPGRFRTEVSIDALQEQHRRMVLQKLFMQSMQNCTVPSHLLDTIAKQTQGFVIADLALLVRNTAQTVVSKPKQSIKTIVQEILKKSKPISLIGSNVTAYRTTETFADIGGMTELKNELKVSVLAGLQHKKCYLRFGLCLPKGILLYGPPGCAKTTIAKSLATEANMTFIATSAAEVYSPYVGCSEKFISKIFTTARKNSPCLVFLDEIDSLVGRRSLTNSLNSSDVQMRILSTLLTEMDGIISSTEQNTHILVVAATNRPDMVDDALIRPGRFDKLIHVPEPDNISRMSILAMYEKRMPFANDVDFNRIVDRTKYYSGADICNLCNEAAIQAFQRDFNAKEIINDDFENVLNVTKSSLTENQILWYYRFKKKYLK